jgi:FtsH-binding integral membrane protein
MTAQSAASRAAVEADGSVESAFSVLSFIGLIFYDKSKIASPGARTQSRRAEFVFGRKQSDN